MIPFYIKSELLHCPYATNKDIGLAYGTLQFRESAGPLASNGGLDFDIEMDMDFINDLANTALANDVRVQKRTKGAIDQALEARN